MAKFKLPKIEELLDAGVHFGHQVRRWDPEMEPYIFTVRSGIHIIDLEKTHEMLKGAAEALYEIAKQGGQIIFVGTKRQAAEIVKLEAERCGALYVNDRWLGGTITNFKVIKKNVDKLVEMIRKREAGDYKMYTKKERLMLDREIEGLQRAVGGIVGLRGLPAALFVIDTKREKTAVREAKKAGVPVAALIDTNSDPTDVSYPIPGNDDAIRSIVTIVKVISDAVESGYRELAKKEKALEEKKKEEEIQEAAEGKPSDESSGKAASEVEVKEVLEEIEKKVEEEKKEEVEKKKTSKGKEK